MESGQQPDRGTYRLILFGQDRREVLLATEEAGFLLPCVEIPCWQRVAEHLTAATKSRCGCVAISLFAPNITLPVHNSSGHRYQVMECVCNSEEHASDTVWKSIRSLTRDSFQDEADYRALQQLHMEANSYESDPASPFARRGWFTELRSWVTRSIEPSGLHLSGPFRQFNASPSFSLIRFETNGPAVWFKAVGEPSLREFPITLKLAQLFPEYIPRVIGTQPAWNGWLSLEATGTNLDKTKEITNWTAAAAALAKLQIESIPKIAPIVDAGARDVRVATLAALVDPFLDVIGQFMERQPQVPPPILTQEELALLGLRIQDSLTLLGDMPIPDGLGHLDLNPGNVIVSADGLVFLDWAEAYVGHPFFSFEYLLEHFRRAIGGDVAHEARLVASYSAPWQQLLSTSVIAEARLYAPLLAVFAYAAGADGWKDPERLRNSKIARYLRGLARRMHREATQIGERRVSCLN